MKALMLFALAAAALAQQQQPLTLERAVREAGERYPAMIASGEQAAAAAAGVSLARTEYLPRLDFVTQANRATRNNVFGMLLPQPVIPPISGPVLGTNNLRNVWGSAVGFQAAWEPFDFGLRGAHVATAQAGQRHAEQSAARTRLEVSAQAADAFLGVVAAQQAAIAARAGVERARVLSEIAAALARAELRPGADASRARAELAVAENQAILAEQAVAVAKAGLAQFVNLKPQEIAVTPWGLLETPPDQPPAAPAAEHPRITEQRAAIEESQANLKALERSGYPRFHLQLATYSRGTGALTSGGTLGGLSGLSPNVFNWGLGMTVTFPAFDIPALRAKRQAEQHRERAEEARLAQVRTELGAERDRARAQLDAARRIAQNTPVALEAARASEQQATARYRAGLGTLVEVADAQRLVTQAEIDEALARLIIWRAMLRQAAAEGDLEPFLRQVK